MSSLIYLIITNILFGIYFICTGGEVGTLLWVYWFQSVFIGLINFLRILTQKKFSIKGLKINGRYAEKTEKEKRYVAFFFLFHYGFFHLVYLVFLLQIAPIDFSSVILLGVLLFGINHTFSFLVNFKLESLVEKNIVHLMFYPYIRIIPMHLIIIFGIPLINSGIGSILVAVLFIFMKTIADALMHIVGHRLLTKKA